MSLETKRVFVPQMSQIFYESLAGFFESIFFFTFPLEIFNLKYLNVKLMLSWYEKRSSF